MCENLIKRVLLSALRFGVELMSFLDLCGAEVVFPEMVRSRVGPPRASLKLLERELGSGL